MNVRIELERSFTKQLFSGEILIDVIPIVVLFAIVLLLALTLYALFSIKRIGEESVYLELGWSLDQIKSRLKTGLEPQLYPEKLKYAPLVFGPLILLYYLISNSFFDCLLISLIMVFFVGLYFLHERVQSLIQVFKQDYVNPRGWRKIEKRDRSWRILRKRVWHWDVEHYEVLQKSSDFEEFTKLITETIEEHHAKNDILSVYSGVAEESGTKAGDIFNELKGIKDFEMWAERFEYYALIRKDIPRIEKWIKRCFDWRIHASIAFPATLLIFTLGSLFSDLKFAILLVGSSYFGCALLLGLIAIALSALCANVGVAVVLDLELPLNSDRFGDPIYKKLGSSALLLSALCAVILGIGFPLLLREMCAQIVWPFMGALLISAFIAGIFLVSIIGLHKGMKETKEYKRIKLRKMIEAEKNFSKKYVGLKNDYTEVETMRVWSINVKILSKLTVYSIVPLIVNFRDEIYDSVVDLLLHAIV